MRARAVRALALLATSLVLLATAAVASPLSCGVCEAIVDEVNAGIASTPVQHSVQTRFRIDEKKRIPYARTEHNLLEILEGEAFLRRFDSYGVVRPATRSHLHLRRAYQQRDEGKPIEPITRRVKKTTPTANKTEEAPAAATQPATDAAPASDAGTAPEAQTQTEPRAASGDTTPASADAAAPAAAAAATLSSTAEYEWETKTFSVFEPAGSLPLSLAHGHAHLLHASTASAVGLVADTSSDVRGEIRSGVSAFLEEHLDETLLLFHRDVPDLKRRLCMEVTEACVPKKKKKQRSGGKKKQGKGGDQAQPAADAEQEKTQQQSKDEL